MASVHGVQAGTARVGVCSTNAPSPLLSPGRLGFQHPCLQGAGFSNRRAKHAAFRPTAGCTKVDKKGVQEQLQGQRDRLRDISQLLATPGGASQASADTSAGPVEARKKLAEVVSELDAVNQQLLTLSQAQLSDPSSSSSSSSEDEECDEAKAEAKQRKIAAKLEKKAAKQAAKMQKKAQKRARKAATQAAALADLALIEDPQLVQPPGALDSQPGLLINTLTGTVALEMPRDTSASRQPSTTLFQVCQGKDCCKRGSAALLEHAEYALADTPVSVAACKCLGECKRGPNVGIKTSGQKKPIVYTGVQTDDVQRIAEAHIERQRSLSL